jgi:hypothetical protein
MYKIHSQAIDSIITFNTISMDNLNGCDDGV